MSDLVFVGSGYPGGANTEQELERLAHRIGVTGSHGPPDQVENHLGIPRVRHGDTSTLNVTSPFDVAQPKARQTTCHIVPDAREPGAPGSRSEVPSSCWTIPAVAHVDSTYRPPVSVLVYCSLDPSGSARQPSTGYLEDVEVADVDGIASRLPGVTKKSSEGLTQWRYKGRLVARQLDAKHVVIRSDFEPRRSLLSRHPETFSVPTRYQRHMMVVADLEAGDEGAIEDAVMAAWALQSGHG
jgi:hypothetical protein